MIIRRQFRQARDRFVELLENPDSQEPEWQALFSDYPFILTECLELGIEQTQLIACKPGKAEADFYFYPRADDPLSRFGVIEIKRPKTTIIRKPRKEVLRLTSDAATALAQAEKYALELGAKIFNNYDPLVVFGNSNHLIVIAGMSNEYACKVTTELEKVQADRLFPSHCRLVYFDELSELLAARTPPIVHVASEISYTPSGALEIRRLGLFQPRQMYPATCTDCGLETEVPFEPTGGEPVYCRDCYQKRRKF